MIAIDDRDVRRVVVETLRKWLPPLLVGDRPALARDDALIVEVSNAVSDAIVTAGDEMPDHIITAMARYVRQR